MKPHFKPVSTMRMPDRVHRAFYSDGRQPEHTMAKILNGFDVFVDVVSSSEKKTTWVHRSAMGKGVRFWCAEERYKR